MVWVSPRVRSLQRSPTGEIFGTPIFGPAAAQKGYALNKMCFSFNDAANRAEFVRDEAAYCAKFGLTGEQTEAILKRDLLKLWTAAATPITSRNLPGSSGSTCRTSERCRPV